MGTVVFVPVQEAGESLGSWRHSPVQAAAVWGQIRASPYL